MDEFIYVVCISALAVFILGFMCSSGSEASDTSKTSSKNSKKNVKRSNNKESIEERIRRRKNVLL